MRCTPAVALLLALSAVPALSASTDEKASACAPAKDCVIKKKKDIIQYQVSDIASNYKINEAKMDHTIKDLWVIVHGSVDSVAKSWGSTVVHLRTGQYMPASMFLASGQEVLALDLMPGNRVSMLCMKIKATFMQSAAGHDCYLKYWLEKDNGDLVRIDMRGKEIPYKPAKSR